jgi:integrase
MTQTLSVYPTTSSALLAPVDHITPEQKDSLLAAVTLWRESAPHTERRDYIADRDALLIRWLWHTGMRVSDAMAIRYDDINHNSETVRFIVSKRSRRTPFIHTITLSKAIMFETMKFRDRWQIVITESGGRLFPITRQNVNKQLQKYRLIACIPPVSAHKFRHGCAMNLLNQGVPPVEIAFRLAHSSTQVTESVYARMNTDIERKMLEGVEW